MKKLTLLFILFIGSLSYGQVILYQNAPDRQKITEFEKQNDSLIISLENSGTNKVYLGDLRTDISGKANINSPTFTGNVIVPTATISDAAVNLGQMMDSLATIEVSASGIVSQYMDSDKTLEQSDFGKYIYTDTSIELTIDNTPAVSSKIGLKVIDIDSTITVIPDGVTFTGDGQDISQGFVVDSLNLATVFKLASNLYAVDGVYKPYVPPSNLYSVANAASVTNEANSTTGISPDTKFFDVTSSSTDPYDGSYSLLFTYPEGQTGQVKSFIELTGLGLEIGKTYKVNFVAKRTGGGNFSVELQNTRGWSVAQTTGSIGGGITTWTEYELIAEASSASPLITIASSTTSIPGYTISIDSLIITEF